MLALAAAFVALGLWLAGAIGTADWNYDPPGKLLAMAGLLGTTPATAAAILGWLCVLIFGVFGAGIGLQLRDRGPVMRIDNKGIWWKSWSDATIPWDQVRNPRERSVQRQRFLAFDLIEPARFPSSRILGRLAGANRVLGHGDINLNVTGTDRKFAELRDAFFSFYPGG